MRDDQGRNHSMWGSKTRLAGALHTGFTGRLGMWSCGRCREFKAHQICGLREKMIILSFAKDSKA